MTTTTHPATAEQLASAVCDALTDFDDFFEQPDGVQVIKINGYSLRIFDDIGEDAPHGISWWIDTPDERGAVSDGWEELPAAKVADEAAILAAHIQRASAAK